MNHKKVAEEVVNAIGGKENVTSLTHCITRLRFKLKNTEIPNKEEVEKIEGVVSVVEKGGQYQVVIGNQVEPVFDEVIKLIDLKNEEIKQEEDEKKGNIFDQFTATMSGIFLPVLGILAATGTLKGILSICTAAKILSDTAPTYVVLYAIANVLFYFFPIFLGSSAAKHFKMDQYIGMAIGGAMIYPTITAMAAKTPDITFLAMPLHLLDYSSSVFPVIIAVWIASMLIKPINKILPQGLKFFLAPFIVLVIMVPLTLIVVGPVLTFFSKLLSSGTVAIYNFNPILGGLVLGGPWLIIVMLGLHWAFIPIFINNMATNGSDGMLALLTANMFAMAGTTIAIAIKTKDPKLKNLSWSTVVTCLVGVCEPALYGVVLPLKKPLIMCIIGGSIGGAIAGAFKSRVYAMGGSALLQIPMLINPKGIDMGFYGAILGIIVAFIVGFILTYMFGYSNKSEA